MADLKGRRAGDKMKVFNHTQGGFDLPIHFQLARVMPDLSRSSFMMNGINAQD